MFYRPDVPSNQFYKACSLGQYKELEKFLKENKNTDINAGSLNIAKLLLDSNAHMDTKNKDDETPFLLACQEAHFEVTKFLVSKKCDINATSANGKTGLHYACLNGSLDIVKLLVDNKANLDAKAKSSITPLMLACLAGNLEIVKYLVAAGCDIFATCGNNEGFSGTALSAARYKNHEEIVNFLELKL